MPSHSRPSHPIFDQPPAVPVEVFDANSRAVHQQLIRLSPGEQTLRKELSSGTYLVRAPLPSGEIVADTVTLTEQRDAHAVFKTQRAPADLHLSWAYLLQRPPQLQQIRDSRLHFEVRLWLHEQNRWSPVGLPITGHYASLAEVHHDTSLWGQAFRVVLRPSPLRAWREFPGQYWLQVRAESESRFVALPPSSNTSVLVSTADPAANDEERFRVLVGSGDPSVQALLGFLSVGDFESARVVGEDSLLRTREMLLDDPISAAVVGYFLIRVGKFDQMREWTRNLANWFRWLPDGPIIRAWHLMNRPDAKNDHRDDEIPDDPRDMLLTAAQRGVPFYSDGLRLLYDGLGLIEQQDDSVSVREALNKIRPYAAATFGRSPVTYFGGTDPAEPELVGHRLEYA